MFTYFLIVAVLALEDRAWYNLMHIRSDTPRVKRPGASGHRMDTDRSSEDPSRKVSGCMYILTQTTEHRSVQGRVRPDYSFPDLKPRLRRYVGVASLRLISRANTGGDD